MKVEALTMLWWETKGDSRLGQKVCDVAVKSMKEYKRRGYLVVGNVPPPKFKNLFTPWLWGGGVLEICATNKREYSNIIPSMYIRNRARIIN